MVASAFPTHMKTVNTHQPGHCGFVNKICGDLLSIRSNAAGRLAKCLHIFQWVINVNFHMRPTLSDMYQDYCGSFIKTYYFS